MKRAFSLVLVAASLLWTAIAEADPVRILVAAGQGQGLPGEPVLKYADTDAERVRDVFTALGGVRPENAIVVLDATATTLTVAIVWSPPRGDQTMSSSSSISAAMAIARGFTSAARR